MTKPLTLYSTNRGPNPWKVAIILKELGLPYESIYLDHSEMKKEPYEAINPNGRVPALIDPNTNITLWESGAIIEYLIDYYDKEHKLSPTDPQGIYSAKTWLHFQMSGQGPYFGQRVWFAYAHSEKLPSAIERYENEIKRVLGVIDRHLKKQGTEYLIGNKVTYADLAWVPWWGAKELLLPEDVNVEKEFPAFFAWDKKLNERSAVKAMFEEQKERIALSARTYKKVE